jgi:hypothetical protein
LRQFTVGNHHALASLGYALMIPAVTVSVLVFGSFYMNGPDLDKYEDICINNDDAAGCALGRNCLWNNGWVYFV